jgi:regulator of sirC expression with transglutaminase-like and TPR domain
MMNTNKKQHIKALLLLLEDPDESIFEVVEKELLNETALIIPELEAIWETTPDDICQARIENLIRRIRFKDNYKRLCAWTKQPLPDLLEGFILASKYHYPDLNVDRIYRKIEEIRKKVWVEINNSFTSLEKITVLNHILFNDYQFSISPDNIDSPKNCFINNLLETGIGNPVSIALLYNIIAQKLNLPVRFIDLPKNPLLGYVDHRIAAKVHPPDVISDILFYINPANKGSITGRKELEYVLKKMNYDLSATSFEASSPRLFLLRLLQETGKLYKISGQDEKTADICEMITILIKG